MTLPPAVMTSSEATNGQTKPSSSSAGKIFSAQSYLRYQGEKFVLRFDANCYVHLTRKMDTHDVARGRAHWGLGKHSSQQSTIIAEPMEVKEMEEQSDRKGEVSMGEKRLPREGEEDDEALARVLNFLSVDSYRFGAPPPKVQVVSIESDGLFAPPEQEILHHLIRGSKLVSVKSTDGHDGFLLEFEQINRHVETFLQEIIGDIYSGQGVGYDEWKEWGQHPTTMGTGAERQVQVSEVDDVTRW